jgi:antagonist of KipI
MTIRVERAGLLTTVQDLGRWGHQHEGVSPCGAMDELSFRVANLLVGNDDRCACIEITLSDVELVFERAALIALTGPGAAVLADHRSLSSWTPAVVDARTRVRITPAREGRFAYLAVAGGFDVPPVLGSRSTDIAAGFGGLAGRRLQAGDRLPIGVAGDVSTALTAAIQRRGAESAWGFGRSGRPAYEAGQVRVVPSEAVDLLTPASVQALWSTQFRVSARSDRRGVRLEGTPLALTREREMVSEAVVFGTVQLPPSGMPIVLMADRQTTGGYPRLGEIASVDLPVLAQRRPGDAVRLAPIAADDAEQRYLEREADLTQLRQRVLDIARTQAPPV